MDIDIMSNLWLWLTIIIEYAVMGFLAWYFAYHIPRQPYALILRREQDIYAVVKKKILKTTQTDFSFGEHSYLIFWNNCAFLSDHQKPVMLYIEGSTNPVVLAKETIDLEANSQKLHLIFGKEIVKQLVEASKQTTPMSMNIVMMILVGAVSFLIGVFVAPYLSHQTTAKTTMMLFGALRGVLIETYRRGI